MLDLLIIYENIYLINLRAPVSAAASQSSVDVWTLWEYLSAVCDPTSKCLNTQDDVWENTPRAITHDTEEGTSLGN